MMRGKIASEGAVIRAEWIIGKHLATRQDLFPRTPFLDREAQRSLGLTACWEATADDQRPNDYFQVGDDPTSCGLSLEAGGGTAGRRANATIRIGRVASVKKLRVTGCW